MCFTIKVILTLKQLMTFHIVVSDNSRGKTIYTSTLRWKSSSKAIR